MRLFVAAVVAVATTLSGCAPPNSYCMRPARYLGAETLPPLQAPEGLTVPQSPNALVIPPPPATYIPFGRKLPDPKSPQGERNDCLDQPPRMPLTGLGASAPANATPMSAAPPSESPAPSPKPSTGPTPAP
jgi:hypothetical protein